MIEQFFQGQAMFAIKLILAAFLGFIIAWDRKWYGKGAGMRTYGLIAMGSCLLTICSTQFISGDPSRVAAQIVTGMGFIGAGIIWQKKDDIVGVTTAAGLWVSAAIGIAIALDLWLLAIISSILTVILFNLRKIIPWA